MTTETRTIKSITALIERLESLHADLDPRLLTLRQYEQVGWARRPVETLLEQCREEAESLRSAERHAQGLARVLAPKGAARSKGAGP